MRRNKKRKRAAAAAAAAAAAVAAAARHNHDSDDDEDYLDPDDLTTTVNTLRFLTRHPSMMNTTALRDLRGALHPLVQLQLQRYDKVDYCAKATRDLQSSDWSGASGALEGALAFGQVPKQGTVQRWVRFCDAAPSMTRFRLLDAILRASQDAATSMTKPSSSTNIHDPAHQLRMLNTTSQQFRQDEGGGGGGGGGEDGSAADGESLVRRLPPWIPATFERPDDPVSTTSVALSSGGVVERRSVLHEVGQERQPPNVYDLDIWTCSPNTVRLGGGNGGAAVGSTGTTPPTSSTTSSSVLRQNVPNVNGAFLISGALSRMETKAIIATAESLGYVPNHPVDAGAPTGIDACEWLVDPSLLSPLFERVKDQLTQILPSGARLAGINARWRLFRYGAGAVYRPHIDGSWPSSNLSSTTGEYVHDSVPSRRSRLTFLVYLNDDFEGGETTFFLPSNAGGLDAHGVTPQVGAILCFPQGNTASLIHEGSPVSRGVKYVARSDVLYDV